MSADREQAQAARLQRIRERQAAHNERIEAEQWFTSSQLAARWNVGQTTVLMLPRERLPYTQFGLGKRPRRRYSPAAVAAFEAVGAPHPKSA
jgi:hypothetical protein